MFRDDHGKIQPVEMNCKSLINMKLRAFQRREKKRQCHMYENVTTEFASFKDVTISHWLRQEPVVLHCLSVYTYSQKKKKL